jgi:hypothetical protein
MTEPSVLGSPRPRAGRGRRTGTDAVVVHEGAALLADPTAR